MGNARFISFASAVSEIQQSDIFMTVKSRMLETPKANLNGVRVTPAFVDEIIANEERYATLPLYADVRALKNGKYNRLGHLYDAKTGEFHSTQIGSFYKFEKEEFKGGCYLVGYARIPKRDKSLAKAIAELFAEGSLKFSFEISCGEYTELEDGTMEIDASENNFLEGTAIVTFPACEDAVALELVAQRQAKEAAADDTERGETEMAENKEVVAEEAVETQVETAETAQPSAEENSEAAEVQTAETEHTENTEEATAETEESACKDKRAEVSDTETAAVYVTTVHREEEEIHAYDTNSGVSVDQNIEVTTLVSHEEQDAEIVEADDGIHIAETENADSSEVAEESVTAQTETSEEIKAETEKAADEAGGDGENSPVSAAAEEAAPAENEMKTIAEQLQKLAEAVNTLTAEVNELKEAKKVVASKSVTAEINPFVEDINAGPKYGLLEKYGSTGKYTLLSH